MLVNLEKFQGPLALLLQLIEKEELDITEISLAKITDQYIEYIRSANGIKPDELADFLVIATKLLLIKSKALLPYLFPEEEAEIEEFEHQLLMYKEFLEAAKVIEEMINKKKFMFAREFNQQAILADANIFSPPKKITAVILQTIFQELIVKNKPIELLEEKKLEHVVNIEEKILAIQQMLIDRIKINFNIIKAVAKNKMEVIVSFLALLELIKQRDISAVQISLFAEIEINKTK
ncbi:segregation/condensation protein A [Patescibacteria group bacterium]|nr:segregation/condensation protein A [Patescibacteria group bacterium]MBU0880537.1 segregation/condensation protein A [Patescibacteria group bacterium]MBU0897628.1 segregation/condensation protein A [Patescibacteria group bacterium]MBU1062610.1 segregation/condensation protein A [Patescibacteria group bacterium]MBU1783232.1 segregation/condensation protein A [Patescibacteria group bacterium]